MKEFMDKDFLLESDIAKTLFHDYAEKMPIIDYHCHINPREIYEDRKYTDITKVWLNDGNFGDHYKWRIMRACGYPESLITGSDADPKEKFRAWADSVSRAVGNPLVHWTQLELQRYFGYNGVLSPKTADEVYELCNKKLAEPSMSVRGIIDQSNVKLICTTDDPVDSLEWHKKIAEDPTCKVKVLPACRPDKAINIEKDGFAAYIAKLSEVSGVEIKTVCDVKTALSKRLEFFDSMGCVNSDHGLDYVVYSPASEEKLNKTLSTVLSGGTISQDDADEYKTAILLFLGEWYAKHNWVMQIHYGAQRNVNYQIYSKLGPDTGNDAIGNKPCGAELALFLGDLAKKDAVPKMVLYSLNQHDNEALITIGGCFAEAGINTKIQLGSAWWFNDTKAGMIKQLTDFANLNVLGNFIGMLTDSRSFLSYTRHEYFRRILCNLIGQWVENGECPNDIELLGKLVQDISYNNTVKFFGFKVD